MRRRSGSGIIKANLITQPGTRNRLIAIDNARLLYDWHFSQKPGVMGQSGGKSF
jgi:hypothetical protein